MFASVYLLTFIIVCWHIITNKSKDCRRNYGLCKAYEVIYTLATHCCATVWGMDFNVCRSYRMIYNLLLETMWLLLGVLRHRIPGRSALQKDQEACIPLRTKPCRLLQEAR